MVCMCVIMYIHMYEWQYAHCFDKDYNIFQTRRFNHTMIFFKLID